MDKVNGLMEELRVLEMEQQLAELKVQAKQAEILNACLDGMIDVLNNTNNSLEHLNNTLQEGSRNLQKNLDELNELYQDNQTEDLLPLFDIYTS